MTTSNNNIPKALKDAIKLRKEIDRTRQLRANCSRLKHSTEERIRALENDRVAAYTRAARGDRKGKQEAEQIEAQINEARRSIESTDAEVQGAFRAEEQANDELSELLARELTTFADHAEQSTQAFIEAAEQLEPLYRELHALWLRAQEAWAPLRSALFEVYKLQTEQAGFFAPEVVLASAAAVGNWPFPQPDEMFPMVRIPRPAALEEQHVDEPDDEEEDE